MVDWDDMVTVVVLVVLGYLVVMGVFMTIRIYWKIATRQPMEDVPGFTSADLEQARRRKEERR